MDSTWLQIADYEHIHFKYHKFQEHGHLFKDSPLNHALTPPRSQIYEDLEGFEKVVNRRKTSRNLSMNTNMTTKILQSRYEIFSKNVEETLEKILNDQEAQTPKTQET